MFHTGRWQGIGSEPAKLKKQAKHGRIGCVGVAIDVQAPDGEQCR